MTEMTVIACRADFRSASESARELAREYSRQTSLHRTNRGWEVLVDSDIARRTRVKADDDHESDRDDQDECFDDEELRAELREEIDDNMERLARSDETGWYYED